MPPPLFRFSGAALRQIASILAESHAQFGEVARLRYEALLLQAARDLAAEPPRPSVRRIDGLLVYHLARSRTAVPTPPGRVRRPRHMLVGRRDATGVMEILGIVHERMLLGLALRGIAEEIGEG